MASALNYEGCVSQKEVVEIILLQSYSFLGVSSGSSLDMTSESSVPSFFQQVEDEDVQLHTRH